ncbi:MAG: aldo/keto reductase [Bacteroidales bacterium]|nr:aldo/keto reductase [Bacteroidales bacterium]
MKRRDFIKTVGAVTAVTAATATAFSQENKSSGKETGKMTMRKDLHGEDVSLLGYGCMRWPTTIDAEGKTVIDQEQVNALVDYAIEHGINYFDTAPVYGQGESERVTGIALSRHPRSSYKIATKMSNHRGDWSLESALKMYRHSFEALQTDYIDYYLLHSVGGSSGDFNSMEVLQKRFFDNGLLDFLLKEREAGRIRNLGFSFHGDQQVFDHLLSLQDAQAPGERQLWDFVQIQMNYVDWKLAHTRSEREVNAEYLYGELDRRNIPVVIMEPLLGGRLANLPGVAARQLQERRPDKSLASWAFRFCGTQPRVQVVLSGMTYKEHLVDNLSSFCPLEPLSEDDMQLLFKISEDYVKYPLVPCTDCKYCMPCPYGVDIPGVFAHYNKCVNEGFVKEDRQDPAYRKARRAYLVSLDRNLDKLRQANHCIGCRQCVDACPQRIGIPGQMRRIEEHTEQLKRDLSPL